MGNLKNRARTTSRKRKRNQTEVETAKEAKLVKEIGSLEEAPPCSTPEFAVGLTPVVSSVPVLPRQNVSSSSKKLDDVAVPCIDEEEEKGGFVFFSVDVLRSLFSIVSCPGCKSEGVKIKEIPRKKQGLVAAFQMQCSICLWKHEFLSSNYAKEEGKKSKNSFEVNVRAVMAMRNLGIGHDGLESFCMHMNMQQPMTRNNYNKLIDSLHTVYMNEAEQSMKNAAEQVKAKEQSTDITASFDGSWQKPEETPQHHLCPKGKDSWCGWQRDFANGTNQYQHKKGLPKAVIDAVIPIYDSLADHTLLSRCLDSYTQNPNESLNNLVWKRCPKKIYQGKKVVELCTASAVATYNDGLASVARVLGQLGIVPGYHTTMGILKRNNARIAIAGLQSTEKGKLRRKKLRAIKKGLWDRNKEKEGPIYESGAH
eukprot:gene2475-18136_t